MEEKAEKNYIKSIAVFCGSSEGNKKAIINHAFKLGETLAKQNIDLVFGGSKLGLMGQVADGALENDGLVFGVIPEFLKRKEVVHRNLTELITTQDMQQRKLKMHEMSDGFIMMPGGFGTLEEFFEILTWSQLGLHQKPIGLLNCEGYFNDLISMMNTMVTRGFLKTENLELVVISDDVDDLLEKMHYFKPKPRPKWITKEQT
ncbi:LOG family protein [Haloflavibacter putidus]|uniref:Cytokinin riboside 5'-monophosphate phosphoribohydrolase n=1 Tax=Haloflavibacter putidus TaxID=2576776 RepID=A0A507ZQV1_9FLAO|nr:TIGR00730 family Rossman fold protein [Haloflavibacter putidus]TQD39337.1 TIGR00730 family Rossman fold protein [Haloflavibacter putidus]